MFQIVLIVVYTVFCAKTCIAQVVQFGTCTEVETMKYFDLEKFIGKWYEIERFPTWYEDYGHCAYKTIQSCGRNIEIEHGFIRDGIQYILHINSTYAHGDDAVFVIQQNNIDPVGIPLTVVTTDYTNYAIVYGCKHGGVLGIKYISAWILSRQTTLSTEIKEKAYEELNSIPYVSTVYLEPVPQMKEKCNFHWTAHVQASFTENYE